MDQLPILSGIQPADLCQLESTLSMAYHESLNFGQTLYGLLSGSSDAWKEKIRSGRPFVPAMQKLLDNLAGLGICASEWTNRKWNVKYYENSSRLQISDYDHQALAGQLMLPKGMAEVAASLRSLVKVGVASERESVIKLEGVGQWVSI